MTYKLLPCPFCGCKAILCSTGNHFATEKFFVSCGVCGVETPRIARTRKEAIAAWNRRVDARQLALKTRVCPMCEDCPDGCPVETPKDSRNIVTNADRIRAMSDEELAEWIDKMFNEGRDDWEPIGCYSCINYGTHHADKANIGTKEEYLYECKDCEFENGLLNWLQQPAKEE